MSTHQAGIFDRSYQHHLFFEYCLGSNSDLAAVRGALAALVDISDDNMPVLLAFGPGLWRELGGKFDFPGFSLDGHIPSTQSDLFVWVQARDRADLFDRGMAVRNLIGDSLASQLELTGFVYHDMRDLTGFVDGIGNPTGDRALQAAMIPEPHPGAGGSWVLGQKWNHDLASFNKLPVAEQENVIGRTKADAVEFDDERMPANAHVGRVDVDRDGVAQKIWRRSVPYGTTTEHGLYFLAFSCELDRFDYLMRRMYGIADDAVVDRLLDYTRPAMSSWWYAPSQEWLASLAR
ncbi:Dyp-type peroxidase family protein [Alcanivorax hongdengensis A-11-3]|uniref:Dyp-type peroxidase family protein n=1 Tax=Alcanivorax hongdengensis A-11-3 TaxID=1177179 RepID=L0WE30_9GAMM|nr:Dyp-type peroxidase [Alcanivorax hongdengensis]EKF75093.1 Dyp-type peroxidase family protein [Alcanivorax hongdengensis A-11-3]